MQLWPSTADQYIIAYKSYRQTLLLSPLKSLQVEALWVITHLQQQLAQLKLSEDTVVAELEPQVTRVANGAGVPRCQGWKDMPFVGSSFRYIFCSMRLRYDTPQKNLHIFHNDTENDFSLITSYIHLHPTSCLTLHQMLDGKNTYQKPNQGRGHVLQQANGLGSRLTTIWQQEVVGKNGGGNQMVMVFPLRAENSTGFNYRVGFWGGWLVGVGLIRYFFHLGGWF